MRTITYGISKEIYQLGDTTRETYGMVAYSNADTCGSTVIVASARDITCNVRRIGCLVKKCNEGGLSIIHFNDVVEDFIWELANVSEE